MAIGEPHGHMEAVGVDPSDGGSQQEEVMLQPGGEPH